MAGNIKRVRGLLTLVSVVLVMAGAADADWPMSAANPQRTSWAAEEVDGPYRPTWYRPIEPYISQNVNLIAAEGKIFVSTSKGLYALNAATGAIEWVYATEIPLGNSPTYAGGVLYVGGFDRKLHCIDVATGGRLWTFNGARAGYRTNPLVVDGLVMLGNRDGWFYAIKDNDDPNAGQLAWKYQTGGPILYSAAYKNGVVFFCSQDMHCYALYSSTGAEKWVSQKLHGQGFPSWWPVIYRDYVVLTTTLNGRGGSPGWRSLGITYTDEYGTHLCTELINGVERECFYPETEPWEQNDWIGDLGNEPGDWAAGTSTVNAWRISEHYADHPTWRSRYFLEIETGADWGFDYDSDMEVEYPPLAHTGTKSGVQAPAVVSGYDDVIYAQTNYKYGSWICRGGYSGWKHGTTFVSRAGGEGACDEPRVASGGGRILYESICCDREARGRDVSLSGLGGTIWNYSIHTLCPDYDPMWFGAENTGMYRLWGYYGSLNGVYHNHTNDQNPWVPYDGRIYIHRSNTVLCFSTSGAATKLPLATIQTPAADTLAQPNRDELKQMLADEVQKWMDAGHLHTGWFNAGQLSVRRQYGDLTNYFRNPGETIWVLIRALPHLPAAMQTSLRVFIQQEWNAYPPTSIGDIGWASGARRTWFLYPPEIEADRANYGSSTSNFIGMNIYACWKYAEEFGDAATIFNAVRSKLPAASYDNDYPFFTNEAIAGHWAYLELQKLAGEAESSTVRAALDNMLAHRKNNFQINTPFTSSHYNRMTTARNFVWLTPELGQYMHDEMLSTIEAALAEYEYVEPYWFVSRYEGCLQENTIRALNDYYALFQARAWILKKNRQDLVKYLDVPGFAVGDCFYLHNLISSIEAQTVAPEILPNGGGIYVDSVTVTLVADSAEEDVYYTLDGSEPNEMSTLYSSPFVLSTSATVKARAFLDGEGSPTASAVFTIDTGMANAAPQVDAGSDQEITFPDDSISLDGTVSDNTLPWPPGEVTTLWEKLTGAGTVTFGDSEAVDTNVTFSTPGIYVLRLSAYDGELTGTDDVTITVNQKPNEAPVVDAGQDTAITLPTNTLALSPIVTDDNLPDPPAAVSVTWAQVGGPGTVSFVNPNVANTSATFPMRGAYELRITADDGGFKVSDDIVITVHPTGYEGPIAYFELEGDGTDSSGYGFHGTPMGAPTYSAGVFDQAVILNGTTDYVELPALNLNSNNVTICAWIKRNGTQVNYAGIVFCRGGDTIAGLDTRTASDLGYHWNDAQNTYSWSSGLIVPDNEWVFAALVLEPSQAKIYMGINGVVTSGTNAVSHAIEEFNAPTLIGRDSNQARYFKGMIDAVRVYNRALTPAEIETLANLDQPGDPDITGDGEYDCYDLAAMANNWLWAGEPGHADEDIVKDGSVDHLDFSRLADVWLD